MSYVVVYLFHDGDSWSWVVDVIQEWCLSKIRDSEHTMEAEVDELAVKILAHGAAPKDLRAIAISVKISNDLERIGDEAGTIAESVIHLNKQSNWKVPFREEIVAMGEKACLLLREAIQAYSENDSSKAQQLISEDDQMDALNVFYQKELVGMMQNNPESIARYLDLGIIVKRLERVADHAINIAEDALLIGRSAKSPRIHQRNKVSFL